MSIEVERRVVPRGDAAHVDAAWALKERIHREEGVLKQRESFFRAAWRRSKDLLLIAGDDLVAFATYRRDGYVLFLAVAPDHRGRGYGERLVAAVAEEASSVTCHARASNDPALGFYRHLGFETVRRIDGYYEDGGDALYLRLGDGDRLIDRLSGFFR
ncbi:MAG: GNAT family N-acetyltransferase [Halobacteriaceae archaeon]